MDQRVCESWVGDPDNLQCDRWTEYVTNPYPDHWDTFLHGLAVGMPWVIAFALVCAAIAGVIAVIAWWDLRGETDEEQPVSASPRIGLGSSRTTRS